jgi:molecular chaperone DnaK
VAEKILGIDLGTSSSAAAIMLNGKIQRIPSTEKNINSVKPFPSVVSFNQDGVSCTIGAAAIEQFQYNPKGTIFNIKRKMGSNKKIKVFEKEYPPQFFAALFLIKIKVDAEKFLNEKISKCVITVPANFNDHQRQATKDAAKIAGLDVVRLIVEPVAAAVAYGLDRIQDSANILVFDMGAGTLDVSVIEVNDGFFEVLATSGPTTLGGINMTEKITQWLKQLLEEQNQNPILDELVNAQLQEISEQLKIELSEKNSASFDEKINSTGSQLTLSGSISRESFENMIKPILDESEKVILQILKESELNADQIDRVIPIGGPTKIPTLQSMLTETIKIPEEGIDPDFTVAEGAAIQGAVMNGDPNLPVLYSELTLLNVTPLDFGEEGQKNGQRIIQLMIPKNTAYPTEFSYTFWVNKPMQTEVPISIWQGEDFESKPSFAENLNIGHFMLRGLQVGTQNEINVTYSIDEDGILTVNAEEVGGDSSGEITIDQIWDEHTPPPQIGHDDEVIKTIEMKYRKNTMSPYEIPIDNYESKNDSDSEQYCWMCESLEKAKEILKTHHHEFDKSFFDTAKFELSLQLEKQYVYAFIQLTGGSVYPISIHNSLKEKTEINQRMLVVILVHELLHAIHPDWNHGKIRPAEKKLANLAGYYDALHNMDILFLSGKMSMCNNEMSSADRRVRINC